MDLTSLKYFQAVIEAGSVVAAAARLHRVPSNVTTRIKQLEGNLGVLLFDRIGKRLVPTAAADALYSYATRLAALADDARAAVSGGLPSGTLRIGSMESTAATRLPKLMAAYHQRYPQVDIELVIGTPQDVADGVARAVLDVAFAVDVAARAEVDSAAIFPDRVMLVAEAGHAPIRHPRDVAARTVMAFHTGCVFRRRLEAWYAQKKMAPRRVLEFNSYHAILGCVAAGAGIAYVPRAVLEVSIDAKMISQHQPDRANGHYDTLLLWHRRNRASAARDAFIALAKRNAGKTSKA